MTLNLLTFVDERGQVKLADFGASKQIAGALGRYH